MKDFQELLKAFLNYFVLSKALSSYVVPIRGSTLNLLVSLSNANFVKRKIIAARKFDRKYFKVWPEIAF